MRGSNFYSAVARHALGILPSRKHLGSALVRFKIALSLETSSKTQHSMLTFDQKVGDLAFKIEGVVPNWPRPCLRQNCTPVRDILKILGFAYSMIHQKLRSRARRFDLFAFVIIFLSSKIALPGGASSKFPPFIFIEFDQNDAPVRSIRKNWIMCDDDVKEFWMYFVRGGFLGCRGRYLAGGGFRYYRIGILGFVGIVVQI